MRYKPSDHEMQHMANWDAEERLQYFLTRVTEAEEIWSLGDSNGWELREQEGKTRIPVWPYQELARMNMQQDSAVASPQATSLDHFFQVLLPTMIDQHIDVEIIAMPGLAGNIMPSNRLYQMLESMLEAGDYYLEG
jgi:hypothetical protein